MRKTCFPFAQPQIQIPLRISMFVSFARGSLCWSELLYTSRSGSPNHKRAGEPFDMIYPLIPHNNIQHCLITCKMVYRHGILCFTVWYGIAYQYHAITWNNMQYDTIPFNTLKRIRLFAKRHIWLGLQERKSIYIHLSKTRHVFPTVALTGSSIESSNTILVITIASIKISPKWPQSL